MFPSIVIKMPRKALTRRKITFKWLLFLNFFGHAMHWFVATKGSSLAASRVAWSRGWTFCMWSQTLEKVSTTEEQRKQVNTQPSFWSNHPMPSSLGVSIIDRIALFSAIIVFLVFSFLVSVSGLMAASSFTGLSVPLSLGPKSIPKSSSALRLAT